MLKKITLLSAIAVIALTIASFINNGNFAFSYSDGSQGSGYSGSPGDGNKICATSGCHTSSSSVTGWITSNIPGTGYIPNTAYTITLTMTGGSHAFEITSEKSGGTKVGTFSSASSVTIYNSGKSVVANTMFTSKTLTWTSPATGNGPVTFYATFATAKTNAKKCTYSVSEYTAGMSENPDNEFFTIFPNPVKDKIGINYTLKEASNVEINLYSFDGKKVAGFLNEKQNSGDYTQSFAVNNIPAGIYLLEVKHSDVSTFHKIIVK